MIDIAKYYNSESKVIDVPGNELNLFQYGIGKLLYIKMKEYLNQVTQIDPATGEQETYETFLTKTIRTAMEMKSKGIKPGDIISICSHNQFNSTVPFVASFFIGAIVSGLDPSLSLTDTKYLIDMVKPKMIFVCEQSEKLIEDALMEIDCISEIVIFGETTRNIKFSEFLKPKPNEEQFTPYIVDNIEDVCVILFSSGTSGLPKGICLNHKFFMSHWLQQNIPLGSGYASLYWVSSTYLTIGSLLSGIIRYTLCNFDPVSAWDYINTYEINLIFMAPSDAIKLYNNRPEKINAKLKNVFIGGTSISANYLAKIRNILPNTHVYYGYGTTELFAIFKINKSNDKMISVGRPLPGRAYKVVDPETGVALGFNQQGELLVKTKYHANCYFNMPDSPILNDEGYVSTGDIVYYDEEFYFYVVDRIKEMFKFKGWHIVPAKIESVLYNHPDVAVCAIIGIPHPEEDNHILAVVQLKNNKTSEEDIIKYVEQSYNDDRHKLRAGVKFINNFPMTPSGKIKRKELRDMYLRGEL